MSADLSLQNIVFSGDVSHNLDPRELIKKSLKRKETILSKNGSLIVYTGKYTGRSPKDRFIVDSKNVHNDIDWGDINISISNENFDNLYKKVSRYLSSKDELFIFDGFAGADEKNKLHVRIVSEHAYQALFANHLMRRRLKSERVDHKAELTILSAPSLKANPKIDGTASEAFIVLNLDKKIVIIGGTKYSGEIKKSVFTLMNYILPKRGVFPMHCSANMGKNGETALFFGLSGTGKTTLSADRERYLIGDDEHGWSENGIFNFEGGCYAKCIDLKREKEPQIWKAIRKGTLLENVILKNGNPDFEDSTITENTRAAYPIEYIDNAVLKGVGNHPKYIIFLTADACGVLPPVARLNSGGAMYHFLSGYTSKLAGTERGITSPKAVFSSCFGAPFMPLKPLVYANLLKSYMAKYKSKVYLVNTGWSGGEYGVGKRISLKDTRKIVDMILTGRLDKVDYRRDRIFNLDVPLKIDGVNSRILNPRLLWKDKKKYDDKASELAGLFIKNFKKFKNIPDNVISAGPDKSFV